MSSVVSQLEASRVDWTFSHLSRIDAKQFSCVPVGNPVAISTFFYRFSFQWCAPQQMKIVKGCEGNLFSATPAMQGVHVVHNGVFQYICGGFLDRLRILRKRQCRHSGWPWSWRRSCDMVQQRCSTHLEHIACTIFAFVYYIHIYVD